LPGKAEEGITWNEVTLLRAKGNECGSIWLSSVPGEFTIWQPAGNKPLRGIIKLEIQGMFCLQF
jgi:hypothetical protein